MKYILALLIGGVSLYSCTNETFNVEYKAECENCSVTYLDADSKFHRVDDVSGNWSNSFETRNKILVRVTAQNNGDSSSVAVSLFVNGELKDSGENGNRRFAAAFAEYRIE
jgi:hypothetical protein